MKKNHNFLRPGDLVMLKSIGKLRSMVIWTTWNYDESNSEFWPKIAGAFCDNETAIVIELSCSENNHIGAKIYTETRCMGWMSAKHLKLVCF